MEQQQTWQGAINGLGSHHRPMACSRVHHNSLPW